MWIKSNPANGRVDNEEWLIKSSSKVIKNDGCDLTETNICHTNQIWVKILWPDFVSSILIDFCSSNQIFFAVRHWSDLKWNIIYSMSDLLETHPVCKDGQNKFSGLESVQDLLDDPQVGGQGDVALEADVGVLGLRGDVDRHVLALKWRSF